MTKLVWLCIVVVCLVVCVNAQAPVLDLFKGSENNQTFFVPAGSGQEFFLAFATNRDSPHFVASSLLQTVIVEVVGIPSGEDIGTERIAVDDRVLADGILLVTDINEPRYEFRLFGGGGGNSRSVLLSTLHYSCNLTLSAASISPTRIINVTAIDTEGVAAQPQFAEINIIPANLEDPVFTDVSYMFTLNDNATPGTVVGTVTATDPPFDGGFPVTYLLSGTPFSIDELSGTILVSNISVAGFEMGQNFTLTAIAVDQHPVSSRSSLAQVMVMIVEFNDPPVFSEDVYAFSVNEEFSAAYVGQVVAEDGDSGPLTYELPALLGNVFSLDTMTGDISLVGQLDFETQERYEFTMSVTDGVFETLQW